MTRPSAQGEPTNAAHVHTLPSVPRPPCIARGPQRLCSAEGARGRVGPRNGLPSWSHESLPLLLTSCSMRSPSPRRTSTGLAVRTGTGNSALPAGAFGSGPEASPGTRTRRSTVGAWAKVAPRLDEQPQRGRMARARSPCGVLPEEGLPHVVDRHHYRRQSCRGIALASRCSAPQLGNATRRRVPAERGRTLETRGRSLTKGRF